MKSNQIKADVKKKFCLWSSIKNVFWTYGLRSHAFPLQSTEKAVFLFVFELAGIRGRQQGFCREASGKSYLRIGMLRLFPAAMCGALML